ncbi:hypothetical protein OF83DRAFT_1146454 [Amylostereum chailletii]|nr:hypothetical protein OF83DRAFT_1146454 [Amylostereum chailletii]
MSCDPTPTATQFATVTSTNTITTFSDSIQTLPPTGSAILATSCLSSASNLCLASSIVTDITTIPGDIQTVQVPMIITQEVVNVVPTLTLFAPCTGIDTDTTPAPTSTATDSTTLTPSTSPSPSPSSSLPSPTSDPDLSSAPDVAASVTLTPASGVIIQPISTAIVSGSTVIVYTTIATSQTSSTAPSGSGSGSSSKDVPQPQGQPATNTSNLVPILGGTLGGFFFLLGVVGLIWLLIHRHKRRIEMWEDSESIYPKPSVIRRRKQPDLSVEPKPYVYGLVGGTSSLGMHSTSSPPSSPAPSTSLNHLSRAPSATLNGRPESTTGLLALPSFPASSPTPTASRAGSPQGQPRQTHADEFGARPTSMHDERDRRLSLGSAVQLNVHIPTSPAMDYFGLLGDTATAEPRRHTAGSADSGLATPLNPERRALHVVNTPLSPVSTSTVEAPPARPQRSNMRPTGR